LTCEIGFAITANKNTWQDAENLDNTHGYTSYIWIPEETFKVDKMKLRIYAEKFRAYSKSALAGGAQTKTSSSGGGQTKTSTYHSIPHTHDVTIGAKTSTYNTIPHTHDVVIGTKTSTSESTHRHSIGDFVGYVAPETSVSLRMYNSAGDRTCDIPCKQYTIYVPYTGGLLAAHSHDVDYGTKTSASGGVSHAHDVDYGTKTSASGGVSHAHDVTIDNHTHDVTIDAHTHDIDFGIYEEDITGRTLSVKLYDPNDSLLHDFGVVLTGEGNVIIDLSAYFGTLTYGMYKLVLSASGRLRARLVFYELCKMFTQF